MKLHNRYSACCGATVYDDDDICSDCKEHCAVIETCPDCDGSGKVTVRDTSKYPKLIYKEEICETCHGEGEVEE